MLTKFKSYIEKNKLFTTSDKLLVAISGGVDSVVLADLLYKSGYTFSIAHCNFKLRNEDSDKDEALVKNIALKYNADFYSTSFETQNYADLNKLSIQMAARELRYKWFNELKNKYHFNYLLTAHHANDAIETSLLNYIKGAGIRGIKGIDAKNDYRCSPLLSFSKKNILKYAIDNKIEWREDLSNEKSDYERNYLRNEVIPLFAKVNGSYSITISDGLEKIQIVDLYYKKLVEKEIAKDTEITDNQTIVKFKNWEKETVLPKLLYLLEPLLFRFSEIKRIAEALFELQSGKIFSSTTHQFCIDRGSLIIEKKQDEPSINIKINTLEELMKGVLIKENLLTAKLVNDLDISLNKTTTLLINNDAGLFPLTIRSWENGDTIIPFGRKKSKKISYILQDLKISVFDKRKVLVLENKNKEILWILDLKVSEITRIKEGIKPIIALSY